MAELYEKRIKKTNFFFFVLVILYLGFSLGSVFVLKNIFTQNFLGEAFLFLIGTVFLLCWKVNWREYLRLKKIDFLTIIFSILYTLCIIPVVAVINGLSMILVENRAAYSIADSMEGGFLQSILAIAIMPGIVEEFLFRGIIYRGYRQARPLRGILYSAFLFGAMHMNFNQLCYAFFMGFALALLAEVTDSLFPGIIVHILFNAQSLCLIFLEQKLSNFVQGGGSDISAEAASLDVKALLAAVAFYLPFAILGCVFALLILRFLAKKNQRYEYIMTWFDKEERQSLPRPNMLSVSLILGVLICLGICIIIEFL